MPVPIIDLFAGPGGLGEGFSALRDAAGNRRFRTRLSIEMDPVAHQTLRLRAFYRHFDHPSEVPPLYWDLLRGDKDVHPDMVISHPGDVGAQADREAWQFELRADPTARAAVHERVSAALGRSNRWVLLGGPPCQAYSLVGRSRNRGKPGYVPEKDHRHYLYQEYLRVIADHQPAVFVMENVKGLLSATVDGDRIFDTICRDLREPSVAVGRPRDGLRYELRALAPRGLSAELVGREAFVVRAEEHGLPQARHRLFVVGIRDDVKGVLPPLAESSLVPARAVLDDLPAVRSGISGRSDSSDAWQSVLNNAVRADWFRGLEGEDTDLRALIGRGMEKAVKGDRGAEHLTYSRKPAWEPRWYRGDIPVGITHHATRRHMESDIQRYLFAAAWARRHGRSPVLGNFPPSLLPAHRNAGRAVKDGLFHDRFRVQLPDRPSTTITSHISKDGHYYIHWDPGQARSLTVREAARLQTFPDDYWFCGGRTAQYHQVGNAVPPLLARQIAESVATLLGA